MNEVVLTNKQMGQLLQLYSRFPDVKFFTIRETHTSGIGANTYVEFTLFEEGDSPDIVVDITDVEVW